VSSTSLSRRVTYGALSAGLLAAGLIPLAASAAGSPCPTYADDAGDAAPLDPALAPLLGDDSLDILSITHSSGKGLLASTVQLAALHDYGSEYSVGDWFEMNFTVLEKAVSMRVIRDENVDGTTTTRVTIGGEVQEFAPEAVYDFDNALVTLTLKQADLEKALGKPLKGEQFTAMTARALGNYVRVGLTWDLAAAEEGVTYTFGDACAAPAAKPAASGAASPQASPAASPAASASPQPSGSPEPSATAEPSAEPSPEPEPEPAVPVPAADCFGFLDEEGDSNAAVGPAGSGDDPDLDLRSVTGRTTDTTIAGHLAVTELSDGPSLPMFTGHRFEFEFVAADKTVVLRATGTGDGTGLIDGTADDSLGVTAVFDEPSSQVVLSVDRAALAKALGVELPDGTVLGDLAARSYARTPATATVADTATSEDPARGRYTIGDNLCFDPRLAVAAPAQVQTSDLAVVSVTLSTSDGRPAPEQQLTARVGNGRAVSATTDKTGAATLSIPVTVAAGTHELVVRSAGSAGDGELRSPLRVLVERTLLVASSSGSGANRTLTATLTDDDVPRRPLAGQRVVFTFGGRSIAATTDGAGRARAQVPAGSTVDVSFAGRSGFLSPAKVRTTA
jgi:hypothetical protein